MYIAAFHEHSLPFSQFPITNLPEVIQGWVLCSHPVYIFSLSFASSWSSDFTNLFLDSSFPSSRSPDFTNLSLDSSMLWMYWKAICIRLDQETYNVLLTFSPYLQTFCFKIVFPVSKHMIVSFAQIQRWLNFPNLSFSDWWPSMSMRQSLIHPHTTPQSWLITEEWMACFWSAHMISK